MLAERDLDYVSAARLRGERAPYVMFVEILPNVMAPIIVEATVRLGYAIFAVAGLTFLGFGVQPPSPDWSLQIAENYADRRAVRSGGRRCSRRSRSRRSCRRQHHRRRSPAGARPVSNGAERPWRERRTRSTCASSTSPTACAARDRQVLRGVSLHVGRGEAYGLVGESGCGKSTAALAIVRYLPRNGRVRGGQIRIDGRDVLGSEPARAARAPRNAVSMVYQNPGTALNPSLRIGNQVAEVFTVRGVAQDRGARARARTRSSSCRSPTPRR